MTHLRRAAALLIFLVLLPTLAGPAVSPALAAEKQLAVVGARVLPVDGPPIEDGVVLIADGKIVAVGPRDEVDVPEGAEVIDAKGLVATPGLIDARSGLFLGAAESRPSSAPDARVADGIDPFDEDVPEVRDAGVTTVFLSPPFGPGVNGAGAAVRVSPREPVDDLLRPGDGTRKASLGVTRRGDPGPIARIHEVRQVLGLLRAADGQRKALEKFAKARAAYEKARAEYGKKKAEWEKAKEKDPKAKPPEEPKEPDAPKPNPVVEALIPVLERKAILRVEAHGAEDVLAALGILDDFDVRLVLEGAEEAPRVLPALAAARVPVVVGPLLADDPDAAVDPGLPAMLADAGVDFAIATGSSPGRASRFLPLHAAAAVAAGLPRDRALRAITLDAARLSGVDARLGSLTPGKDADLVLFSGDPLDTRSRAVRVLVAGETVHGERP